jgi:hypothetical protein
MIPIIRDLSDISNLLEQPSLGAEAAAGAAPTPTRRPARALAPVHAGADRLAAAQVPHRPALGSLPGAVFEPARPPALVPATSAHGDSRRIVDGSRRFAGSPRRLLVAARLSRRPSRGCPSRAHLLRGSILDRRRGASSQVRATPAPTWPGGAACFLPRSLGACKQDSQNCFPFRVARRKAPLDPLGRVKTLSASGFRRLSLGPAFRYARTNLGMP